MRGEFCGKGLDVECKGVQNKRHGPPLRTHDEGNCHLFGTGLWSNQGCSRRSGASAENTHMHEDTDTDIHMDTGAHEYTLARKYFCFPDVCLWKVFLYGSNVAELRKRLSKDEWQTFRTFILGWGGIWLANTRLDQSTSCASCL